MYVRAEARTLQKTKKRNCRSLHSAPPDSLFNPVALMKFVRLSLRRAASVVVG
jgi:hypothetical protein